MGKTILCWLFLPQYTKNSCYFFHSISIIPPVVYQLSLPQYIRYPPVVYQLSLPQYIPCNVPIISSTVYPLFLLQCTNYFLHSISVIFSVIYQLLFLQYIINITVLPLFFTIHKNSVFLLPSHQRSRGIKQICRQEKAARVGKPFLPAVTSEES